MGSKKLKIVWSVVQGPLAERRNNTRTYFAQRYRWSTRKNDGGRVWRVDPDGPRTTVRDGEKGYYQAIVEAYEGAEADNCRVDLDVRHNQEVKDDR